MTMMAVKEGVFRAYAPLDNRGRRKRRGEFMPIALPRPEFSNTRRSVQRDETETVLSPSASRHGADPDGVAELRVQCTDSGDGEMTLLVSGTLDLSTVLPFRDAVFTAIGAKPRHLIVDVIKVRDVDVAGISALITAGRVARLMKVSFSVVPSPSLKTLLDEANICLNVSVTERR